MFSPAAVNAIPERAVKQSLPFGLVCENKTVNSSARTCAALATALLFFNECKPTFSRSAFTIFITSPAKPLTVTVGSGDGSGIGSGGGGGGFGLGFGVGDGVGIGLGSGLGDGVGFGLGFMVGEWVGLGLGFMIGEGTGSKLGDGVGSRFVKG